MKNKNKTNKKNMINNFDRDFFVDYKKATGIIMIYEVINNNYQYVGKISNAYNLDTDTINYIVNDFIAERDKYSNIEQRLN